MNSTLFYCRPPSWRCLLLTMGMCLLYLTGAANCEKPTGLSVSGVSDSTAVLHWEGTEMHVAYEIEVRSKGRTEKFRWSDETTDESILVSGLEPGSTYRFRVRAFCDNEGWSGSTSWMNFETFGMANFESCPKAEDLQVMNLTHESAILAWDGDSYADYFEVEVRSKGKTPIFFLEKSLRDAMIPVAGLSPGGKYQFRVKTICVNGASSGSTSWSSFITPEDSIMDDSCPAPYDLELDSIDAHSVYASWSGSQEVNGYEVALSSRDSLGSDTTFLTTDTEIKIDQLQPSHPYLLLVRSLCSESASDPVMVSFEIPEVVMYSDSCMALDSSGLVPTLVTDSSAIVNWDTLAASEGYQLKLYLGSGEGVLDTVVESFDNTFHFTDLEPETMYTVSISNICIDGISFPTAVSFETNEAPVDSCLVPQSLGANPVDTNYLLTWEVGTGSDSVTIEIRYLDSSDLYLSFTTELDQYLFVPPDINAFYEFRVTSFCGQEPDLTSDWFGVPPVSANIFVCPIPSDLSSAPVDSATAELAWQGDDTAQFLVEIEEFDDTPGPTLDLSSVTPSISVSGLDPGLSYKFRVRTLCDIGDTSEYSSWKVFQLFEDSVYCTRATTLEIDSVTSDQVWISWLGHDSLRYAYQLVPDTTMDMLNLDTVAGTASMIGDLDEESTYYVRVVSLCSDSLATDWLEFATLPVEICPMPEDLRVDSVSATMATISWTGSSSGEYLVELWDGARALAQSATSGESYLTFQQLEPGSEYTVMVKQICAVGDTSAYAESLSFMTETYIDSCVTPIARLDTVDMHSAMLTWTPASNDALYLIEVEHLGLTPEFTLITTTYDTSYLVEGLDPGGVYQWKIAAFCSVDSYSDCTEWMTFTTEEDTSESVCPVPTGLQATMLGTEATLSWDSSSQYFDFEVEVESLDTTPFYSHLDLTGDNYLEISGLSENGVYQFKVNALCESGELSEDSDWVVFTADSMMVDSASGPVVQAPGLAFPNPALDNVTVRIPETVEDGKTIITLTDLSGRIMMSQVRNQVYLDDQINLDVSSLRDGVYQLMVTSPTRQYMQLLVVSE